MICINAFRALPNFLPSEMPLPTASINQWQHSQSSSPLTTLFTASTLGSPFNASGRKRTAGGGDCAFHAALGHWNSNRNCYQCENLETQRKIVAQAVRLSKPEDEIAKLIKNAIESMVMSGDLRVGRRIEAISTKYRAHLLENVNRINIAWLKFEEQLKINADVLNYIEQYHDSQSTLLKDKFHSCLNQNAGALYGIIFSLPKLQAAFDHYNRVANQEFDWDLYLQDRQVIEEYAAFIGTPGNWLLPVELGIIAFALNVTLEFYTIDSGKERQVETYNPGKNRIVRVCFNGVGHYERYIPPFAPAPHLPAAAPLSKPTTGGPSKLFSSGAAKPSSANSSTTSAPQFATEPTQQTSAGSVFNRKPQTESRPPQRHPAPLSSPARPSLVTATPSTRPNFSQRINLTFLGRSPVVAPPTQQSTQTSQAPQAQPTRPLTALLKALKNRDTEAALKLISDKNTEINVVDPYGFTPLHWACLLRHYRLITVLLERGADPHCRAKAVTGISPEQTLALTPYELYQKALTAQHRQHCQQIGLSLELCTQKKFDEFCGERNKIFPNKSVLEKMQPAKQASISYRPMTHT